MSDGWLESEIEDVRREAIQECERCQGREQGDCDPGCRHWAMTASDAEREAAKKRSADKVTRKVREWTGPIVSEAAAEAAGGE